MDAPKVILVAEDEVMLRNMIRAVLSREGYEVLIAADGIETLEVSRAHQGHIDLLLTDVEMPQLDGIGAHQQIRGDRPGTKVLFMSGAVPHSPRLEPWPFIAKPFNLDTLLAKVRAIIGDSVAAVDESRSIVLVVDQDEDRKERTKGILADNGYAVLTASSAEEAEALSKSKKRIDLIISEVMLSGESGVKLAQEACDRNISTLLISHFHPDLLKKVPGFSAQSEFLANPFTPEDLLIRVRQLLKASSNRANT